MLDDCSLPADVVRALADPNSDTLQSIAACMIFAARHNAMPTCEQRAVLQCHGPLVHDLECERFSFDVNSTITHCNSIPVRSLISLN